MSIEICPKCGGEVRLVISDNHAEGTCPNCGRYCGYTLYPDGAEPEPELVQDGWIVHCYEAGDDEHISHEWSERFETEDEAREYATKMKNRHVDSVEVLPRMVEVSE